MPAITPASTMQQQPMMSTGGTLTTTSILSSSQPGVQQGVPAGIDAPGNLPIPPNPQIQGQNKDRKIIWSGLLEYQEKIKYLGPTQPKFQRQQQQCQLSIGAADEEINTTNWPKELIMQLIPQSLFSLQLLQSLFKSFRQVAFHFGNHNVESLRNLHRTMGSGFAGCVRFPPGTQCDVRVLLLMFSNKRKAFIGLIPNDQKAFVDGIRNVIFTHKLKQAQQAQQAGGSPQQFAQQPGLPMGQGMANPQSYLLLSGLDKQGLNKLFSRETIASYDGGILVVGEYAAGKTTLVMNLIDENIPYERQSTDGIDVYFGKLLFDLKSKQLIKPQSGQHSFTKAVYQKTAAYVRNLDSTDIVMGAATEHHNDSITTSSDKSENPLQGFSEMLTLLESSGDEELIPHVPIPILDFAGQIIYYATHQTFITPNGIYVITLDGRRNLREPMFTNEVAPEGKSNRSILENIRLWISSILAYCSHNNKGYPKIVFVATHKDLISADQLDDKKKDILDFITSCITDDNIKSHLVLNELFFVNAQDKNDPEMDRLRDLLSTLITENPQWGNKVPKQFLILETMLASLVEGGKDVMSHLEVEKLNKQTGFEELSPEELELFLHMQYMNGKLTYLDPPELRNHVIINPTLLKDVLKPVVTSVPRAPELKRGRLYKSSIELIWNSDRFKRLHSNKKYFLNLLVYYDILAEMKRYDTESGKRLDTDVFIVPCMITTNPEPSLIEKTLQSDKLISFVFAFRGYDVPTALPNRLMASVLTIWNVKEYENTELMFPGFLAVTVDRKHDLAIRVEQNLIAVYLIHKLKKELIIRDIASSIRECLEENLMRISEVYSFTFNKEMKPQRSVPFDLKLRSRCCLHDTTDVFLTIGSTYECTDHELKTPISELNIWYTDRTSTACRMDCHGIPDAVLPILLNDTQLLRLCNSLSREDTHCLALNLGLKQQQWDEVEDEQTLSSMIKFYSLRLCREKNKTCKDFVKSMESAEINVHTMCKILRQEEVKTELPDKILTVTPSDEMLDKLCIRIGKEWMILGLELGLKIECLEQIELDTPRHAKEASRKMLYEWRNRDEVTNIRDLLYAFGRVGRNPNLIRDILENCSSFPNITPIE